MKRPVFILLSMLLCLCRQGNAQGYYSITHLLGSQNIAGYSVTVTNSPLGTTSTFWCGEGPYWIGSDGPANPGNYTFTFSAPVNDVFVRLTAVNLDEIISFMVNGAPYTLTAANLFGYRDSCGQTRAIVVGGNITAPPGTLSNSGAGAIIKIPGAVSSVAVRANGEENGSVFSISFGGIHPGSNSPVCQEDTLKLFVLPDDPNASYSWTGPAGFTSNDINPVIPVTSMEHEGMYMVTITTANSSFTDSTYVAIAPRPKTAIVYNKPVCAEKDLQLSDTTTLPGVSYQWRGPGNFTATVPDPVIRGVQPMHAGTYELITTLGMCSDTAEATIEVLQPSYRSLTGVICPYEEFNFNGRWINLPGTYHDMLVAFNGCDSVISLTLIVLPAPEISILVESSAASLCLQDTVVCEARGAESYEWYRENILIGNNNRAYIYLSDLSNKVSVTGTAENSCHATSEVVIQAQPCCEWFVPNAFSPNGDGVNDRFAPTIRNPISNPVRSYKMQIFNRFGQLVYSTVDINTKWDGTYKGAPAEIGSYFYHLSAECLGGVEFIRKGDISLVR